MQFPPIKKINQNQNDNYVKNIKKNPVKGGVVSGLGIQGGSIPAEFRQTMKHNNSNQSISGKKFMGTLKQPIIPAAVGVVIQGNNPALQTQSKKNYMSPYSQKLVQKQ